MRLTVRYENTMVTIEVPDNECAMMVEADYERRREGDETAQRRTPQEIIEIEFNRPEYNNMHKFRRHTVRIGDDDLDFFSNILDDRNEAEQEERELCDAIRRCMKKSYADVLIDYYINDMSQAEMALKYGKKRNDISYLLKRAREEYKKSLPGR